MMTCVVAQLGLGFALSKQLLVEDCLWYMMVMMIMRKMIIKDDNDDDDFVHTK